MCFEGQLGSPFDVVVAAAWALMDRDPVASQELLQRQVILRGRRPEQGLDPRDREAGNLG